MLLLLAYYTFLQHTLNKTNVDSCCFACSTVVVVVVVFAVVFVVDCSVVAVATTVGVVDAVVAVIAQQKGDKNKLDASYEGGDIGYQDDAFDGKNP